MNSSDSYSDMHSSEVDSSDGGVDSWSPVLNGGAKSRSQSRFMASLLKSAQTGTQPSDPSSMVSVLFQNQVEIARGMRCVIRIPKQPIEPTKWGLLCEAMAPVDDAISQARETHESVWTYFDGFDFYTTELEARDTRFSDPLITRPNPVFDSKLAGGTFVERQVYVASNEHQGLDHGRAEMEAFMEEEDEEEEEEEDREHEEGAGSHRGHEVVEEE